MKILLTLALSLPVIAQSSPESTAQHFYGDWLLHRSKLAADQQSWEALRTTPALEINPFCNGNYPIASCVFGEGYGESFVVNVRRASEDMCKY